MLTTTPHTVTISGVAITPINEGDRADFLPRHLGAHNTMRFENHLLAAIRQVCPEYSGGYWQMYEHGDTLFLVPNGSEQLTVLTSSRQAAISHAGAGLLASVMALYRLTVQTQNESHLDLYESLLDVIRGHEDCAIITSVLD